MPVPPPNNTLLGFPHSILPVGNIRHPDCSIPLQNNTPAVPPPAILPHKHPGQKLLLYFGYPLHNHPPDTVPLRSTLLLVSPPHSMYHLFLRCNIPRLHLPRNPFHPPFPHILLLYPFPPHSFLPQMQLPHSSAPFLQHSPLLHMLLRFPLHTPAFPALLSRRQFLLLLLTLHIPVQKNPLISQAQNPSKGILTNLQNLPRNLPPTCPNLLQIFDSFFYFQEFSP